MRSLLSIRFQEGSQCQWRGIVAARRQAGWREVIGKSAGQVLPVLCAYLVPKTVQSTMIVRVSQYAEAGWTETPSLPTIRITGPRIETMGDLVNETLNPLFMLGLDPSQKDRYL